MRSCEPLLSCFKAGRAACAVVGWAMVGAGVAGVGGGVFGIIYGTLDGLIHGELTRIVAAALYFALCGAAAGALLGGFCRIIDQDGLADFIDRSPDPGGEKSCGLRMPPDRCKLHNGSLDSLNSHLRMKAAMERVE